MLDTPFARASLAAVVSVALMLSARPVFAGTPHDYDKTGKVISVTRDSGSVYEIESTDSIYTMTCDRLKLLHMGPPECDWNGRPIAEGDEVRFRIEGDEAFMPVNANDEERLLVEMTETKLLPPLPVVSNDLEAAVALGLGVTSEVYHYVIPASTPSTAPTASAPSSSGSMTPVVAVPVTGGAPVVVIPTAPATGGVVTGVPTTGGAPITAIPVAPTNTATPSATNIPAAAHAGTTVSATQRVHVVRVQTESRIYDLACPGRACSLNGSPIRTGDAFALRVDKKWAYLSTAGNPHEQRFAIVSVRNLE